MSGAGMTVLADRRKQERPGGESARKINTHHMAILKHGRAPNSARNARARANGTKGGVTQVFD